MFWKTIFSSLVQCLKECTQQQTATAPICGFCASYLDMLEVNVLEVLTVDLPLADLWSPARWLLWFEELPLGLLRSKFMICEHWIM